MKVAVRGIEVLYGVWMICLREREVFEMARFYDSVNDSVLARVEAILKKGGIEYSLDHNRFESSIKEIMVAEEDIWEAEELLCRYSNK